MMQTKKNPKPCLAFLGPMLGNSPLCVPNPAEELAPRLATCGFEVLLSSTIPNPYLRLLDMLWTLWRHRRRISVVSLQLYSGRSSIVEILVACFSRMLKLKLVPVVHGGMIPEFIQSAFYRRLLLAVLRRADAVVTPSRYLALTLAEMGFTASLIPNGIDISKYAYTLRTHPRPSLVWLRAFHPIYDPQTAIQALGFLKTDFPDICLTMAGPQKDLPATLSARDLASQLGLSKQLQMPGAIPHEAVPALLEGFDVFINTTLYESFGISVMEAAACGLPIVTTNVGELGFLWRDGVDALLIPPSDPQALAASVTRLLREPGLAGRLSFQARQTAQAYDWAVVLPLWVDLFNHLAGRDL